MNERWTWLLVLTVSVGTGVAMKSARGTAQERLPAQHAPPLSAFPHLAPGAPVQTGSWERREVLQRLPHADREWRAAPNSYGNLDDAGAAEQRAIGFPPSELPPPQSAQTTQPPNPTDQPRAETPSATTDEEAEPKFPTVKVTGFMHLDAGWYGQDANSVLAVGDLQDGAAFRRARLQAVGSVAEFTNYSLEMDFAVTGRPSFMDVWLEQTHLPIFGNLRIGHFRQPGTMDAHTSIKQLTFLERSAPFQALDPFRRVGIMAYDTSESELTSWQYSVYRTGGFENAPLGDSRFAADIGDVGGYSFAGRLTHLLWYDPCADGRYLLHVGGHANFGRNTGNDYIPSTPFYQARAIPEFFVGDAGAVAPPGVPAAAVGTPAFADTGRIPSRDFHVYGVELAAQYGPAHFQAEYVVTTADQIGGPSLFYDGGYAQAGYFLTGENRSYNRTFGVFDEVVPYEEFFSLERMGVCGWGAWEAAGRISYVNLNDPDAMPLSGFTANPGRMTDVTLGLNWYWNAFTKIQFNWIHVFFDSAAVGDSDTDIYAVRAQLAF